MIGLAQELENSSGLIFVPKLELEWTFSKTQVLRSTRARAFQQSKLEVPSSPRGRFKRLPACPWQVDLLEGRLIIVAACPPGR
jgi:hypothetical protein